MDVCDCIVQRCQTNYHEGLVVDIFQLSIPIFFIVCVQNIIPTKACFIYCNFESTTMLCLPIFFQKKNLMAIGNEN